MNPLCLFSVIFTTTLFLSSCSTGDGSGSTKKTTAAQTGTTTSAKPYNYSQCIVIEQPLTFGGGPFTRIQDGREVKFCCKPCIRTFEADPTIWMAKLDRWDAGSGPSSLPDTAE